MKKLTLAITLLVGMPATAGHYLGFSTDVVNPHHGLHAMNEACRNTYGNAKICSSKDIFLSPTTTSHPTGAGAMVHPVIVGQNSVGNVVDYSGQEDPFGLSCIGMGTNINSQLMIDQSLRFLTISCLENTPRAVACCAASAAYRISPN